MNQKYQNKTRATQTAALELADITMRETVLVTYRRRHRMDHQGQAAEAFDD